MSEDWVELRRFDDPMQAQMVTAFLRDHGLPVRTRGNAAGAAVLDRFSTVVDIRLDVPRADLEDAREALVAMDAGDAVEQPFRGRVPTDRDAEDAYVPPKKTAAAMMLGFLVPIGAAHFYARHGAAGAIFLAGVVAALLGIVIGGRFELGVAWGLVAAFDIAFARWAVRRHNEGRIPPDGTQRAWALAAVVVAFGTAFVLGT